MSFETLACETAALRRQQRMDRLDDETGGMASLVLRGLTPRQARDVLDERGHELTVKRLERELLEEQGWLNCATCGRPNETAAFGGVCVECWERYPNPMCALFRCGSAR